jgi:hypothetical protein
MGGLSTRRTRVSRRHGASDGFPFRIGSRSMLAVEQAVDPLNAMPVPEPAGIGMLAVGLVIFVGVCRRDWRRSGPHRDCVVFTQFKPFWPLRRRLRPLHGVVSTTSSR